VIVQSVPAASLRLGVSVNADAGDALKENACRRLLGHSNRNDRAVARTRSLNRTDSTPAVDIETDTTRGGASAADDNGTRLVNHEVPPATDTPVARPSGAASATAPTFHQLTRKEEPPPRLTTSPSLGTPVEK
jgi:hypothetical protein